MTTYRAYCNAHPDTEFAERDAYAVAVADQEAHLRAAHESGVTTIVNEG